MSKIEDKAVDIMDKAMVGAEKLSEKLAQLAEQYGPDVVDAGLAVARVTAAQKLLYGLIAVIGSTAFFWIARYLVRKVRDENWDEFFGIGGIFISGALGLFFAIGGLIDLLSIWNWVGVFEPKLWIAHRILEKAL